MLGGSFSLIFILAAIGGFVLISGIFLAIVLISKKK